MPYNTDDEWKDFGRGLDAAERAFKDFQYYGLFHEAPSNYRDIFEVWGLPDGAITVEQTKGSPSVDLAL